MMMKLTIGILIAVAATGLVEPRPIAAQRSSPAIVPLRVYAGSYPRLAHLAGQEGTVELVAVIAPEGAVERVRTVSGPGLLTEPAKAMLSRWLFPPCSGGCESLLRFQFVLTPGMCGDSDCVSSVQFDAPSTITISSPHRRALIN